MPVVMRRAAEEDAGTLVQLNRTVQDPHVGLYPDDFKQVVGEPEAEAFFSDRLKNPDHVFGIAEMDSLPLGYVWFEIQSRPETPFTPARRRLYVHHVSVVPEAQRRGVGAALMRYVEQGAISEAVEEIALATWSANIDAQCFFRARGFTDFTIAFRKTLPKRG